MEKMDDLEDILKMLGPTLTKLDISFATETKSFGQRGSKRLETKAVWQAILVLLDYKRHKVCRNLKVLDIHNTLFSTDSRPAFMEMMSSQSAVAVAEEKRLKSKEIREDTRESLVYPVSTMEELVVKVKRESKCGFTGGFSPRQLVRIAEVKYEMGTFQLLLLYSHSC